MNIRLLKILVITMGLLIIFGFIVLIKVLYNKTMNLNSSTEKNNKNFIIKQQDNMSYKSKVINGNYFILTYENNSKLRFIIIKLSNGKVVKEIDVLK